MLESDGNLGTTENLKFNNKVNHSSIS